MMRAMHNIPKRAINTGRSDHYCEINVFSLTLDWGLNRHLSPGKLHVLDWQSAHHRLNELNQHCFAESQKREWEKAH